MTTRGHRSHVDGFDVQRCAVEETALKLGWLRECPYHGEPFRAADEQALSATSTAGEAAAGGHAADELLEVAKLLPLAYDRQCPQCVHESTAPEDT